MTKWSNVPGMFSIEVTTANGLACELGGKPLPMLSGIIPPGDDLELIIEFKSSGYHQPMSMYGGPDRLGWPEEGEDERELVHAYLSDWMNRRQIELPLDVQKKLFEHYADAIQEVELEA